MLSITRPGDTILIDDKIDILATEWYFEGKDWNLSYGGDVPKSRFAENGVKTIKLSEGEGDYIILAAEEMPLKEIRVPMGYSPALEKAKSGLLLHTIVDHSGRPAFYVFRV